MFQSGADGVLGNIGDPDFLFRRGVPRDDRDVALRRTKGLCEVGNKLSVRLAFFWGGGHSDLRLVIEFAQIAGTRGARDDLDPKHDGVFLTVDVEHVDILPMTTQYEIGVIGAGNAAEGIVHGILRNTILFADRIIASDPLESRRTLFAQRFKIDVTEDNRLLTQKSDILVLAVKPQQYIEVCHELTEQIRQDHLIVSIMAGVSTSAIENVFPHIEARVVRAMPNLPSHVGAGMAGVCKGQHAQAVDLLRAQRIFEAGGRCVVINDESHMDAVTALSGTGPAYFYFFVEALTEAGVRMGLPRQQADILAKQACLGAARMMLESGEPPDVLREKVASPGGTTQAAMERMARDRVFEHICDAVMAACRRSHELGE